MSAFLGARIPKPMSDEFARIAASNDRTVSAELRRLVRRRIAQREKELLAEGCREFADEDRATRGGPPSAS